MTGDESLGPDDSWDPLPAPPPYDTAPVETRVARIFTDHNTTIILDLLLGQLRVVRTDPFKNGPEKGQWQPFTSVGRIEVGRPIVFRMAGDSAFVTGTVTEIRWLGNVRELSAEDLTTLRYIGDRLNQPKRRRSFD